jgi:magnesium-protoporphyrin O-methyltransferase
VARRDARRYRKSGLDKAGRRLVDAVVERGIDGASVLEGGGGIGAIQIELLAAGAATATNVELSGAYEHEAAALLEERGLEGRVERRLGDFVTDDVSPADVVVLHRVVCCYPDHRALVDVASARTTRLLALVLPRERRLTRIGVRAVNGALRLRRCGFRSFVHPLDEIVETAEAHGLRPALVAPVGPVWQLAVLERAGDGRRIAASTS